MPIKKKVSLAPITTPEATKEEIFETNDLGCAAALICYGHKLILSEEGCCEIHSGTVFIFTSTGGLIDDVQDYQNDDCFVPARAYLDTIEMLTNKFYREHPLD